METLIVGFSKPKKWKPFAFLIMKAFNIPYDHVYVKIHSSIYNRDIIYQASKTMVNFMGTETFKIENLIIDEFQLDISLENKIELMKFAIDNAGKPYGIKCAIGMGIVRIFELFGKKIKNPFRDGEQTYVCSELGGYILDQYAGQQITGDIEDMTPLVVHNYLLIIKALKIT